MKLWEKQAIFAQNVSALIHYITKINMMCTLGEVYRTQEQAAWYAERGIGIKNSLHCQKLAIDINLFTKEGDYLTQKDAYEPIGEFWESLHPKNRWGGRFKRVDCVHFEMLPE